MSRCVVGAVLAVVVLLLAGCGEDAQQEAAREEVQAHVASLGEDAGYTAADAHCTKAAGVWFGRRETSSFLCAVPRQRGGCDWFTVAVDRGRAEVTVRLRDSDAGCVLPA